MQNSLIGSPSLTGQSSGSTPLINARIASCSVCCRCEVEGMNDSGVESVLLHLLVGHLALHLTLDPPLLADHQVPHPLASAQVIHNQ